MFETVICTTEGRDGWKSTLVVSLAAHAVILTLLVLLPMIYFTNLAPGELVTKLFFEKPNVAPPQPPPPSGTPPAARVQRGTNRVVKLPPWVPPQVIPTVLPPPEVENLPELGSGVDNSGPGTPDGLTVGIPGGSPAITGPMITRTIAPPPPPPRAQKHAPILVSILSPGGLIYKVEPVYPELARKARVSGAVKLEALVSEEGVVAEVTVLGGHPLLREAAVTAVKQWRYRPTILNGEPVPVKGSVTVHFILN